MRRALYASARWLVIVAGISVLAGCASTTLQSTWMDPGYRGGPFKRFLVVGLSARDVTARRVLEDVVVHKLKAGGCRSIAGLAVPASNGPADEAAFTAAVAKSGADAMLMVRLIAVENADDRLAADGTAFRLVRLLFRVVRLSGGHAVANRGGRNYAIRRPQPARRLERNVGNDQPDERAEGCPRYSPMSSSARCARTAFCRLRRRSDGAFRIEQSLPRASYSRRPRRLLPMRTPAACRVALPAP
jgi:hypothetical protein